MMRAQSGTAGSPAGVGGGSGQLGRVRKAAVPRNYHEAMKWFRRQCRGSSALFNMARVSNGQVLENIERRRWYRQAADREVRWPNKLGIRRKQVSPLSPLSMRRRFDSHFRHLRRPEPAGNHAVVSTR
jgi:hypothetical protein